MISAAPLAPGKVVAVSLDDRHRFGKAPRLSIVMAAGRGIEGDAHCGPYVKHRYLARRDPRALNLRQVHLIPNQLLDALRKEGYEIGPGRLGENITTAGLDLELLPLNTELLLGATARIRLTGLRMPCVLIDRFAAGLKSRLANGTPGPPFRAGVMGIVADGGDVFPGDDIGVELPDPPRWPLPTL